MNEVRATEDTRSLLYEANLLIGELERRKREEKLKYYKPHDKQMAFHRCDKRNRWALGGNRTGKTEVGAAEAVWMARGTHPFRHVDRPTDGWVVSLTNEVQRDVAQAKVLSYLNPRWIKGVKMREGRADDPDNGIIDFIMVDSIHGGVSKIGFKSCDQGRERFQGTSKHWIWFDEEPPLEIYQECVMRTLDCAGDIWGTMTPLKGLTWVYNVIYLNEPNDPEVWYVSMTWEDNPYLNKDEIDRLVATMSEDELEARREGRFVALTGLVYKEFRESVHVIDPFDVPREWQDTMSIDPGLDAPLSCHWYAVDHDGNVYVVAEHYRSGWSITGHMREIEHVSRELDWKRDVHGHLSCVMDTAADQRTLQSEKSVAELFRREGLNVNTNVNKSKWVGIQTVKQYLELRSHFDEERWPKGKPKLFIFSTCPEMIKEIKKYRWKATANGGKEEPVGVDDHAMDELRYYLMTRPEPYVFKPVVDTTLRDHKRRQLNQLKRRWKR